MADDFGIGSALDPTQGATISGVPDGAEPAAIEPAAVNVFKDGKKYEPEDLRVMIKVPEFYLTNSTAGGNDELREMGGIVFPYTPSITYDVRAEYNSLSPIHSNYAQHFFKSSSVGAINITAKFTVQNSSEAFVYLATRHLLKALTKMRFGNDILAGAPPPVCRLSAYGNYMLKDIPIVIQSFRINLPAEVDYYNPNKGGGNFLRQIGEVAGINPADYIPPNLLPDSVTPDTVVNNAIDPLSQKLSKFGEHFIPMSSEFAITCLPLYSRREMSEFSVTKYLNEYISNTKYL